MGRVAYEKISQAASDNDNQDSGQPLPCCRSLKTCRNVALFWFAISFALCSATVNCVLLYQHYYRPWELLHGLPSRYAGIPRNVPIEYVRYTDHASLNRTLQDAAWQDPELDPSNGYVALHDKFVMRTDLPHSQRWPWDSSKGVYALQNSHDLHCLHTVREAYNEYHDGVEEEQRIYYGHVMHCLNILLQTVTCNADDTPLYFGRLHANVNTTDPRAGIGSIRMCRSLKDLNAWSRSRSACYAFGYGLGTNISEFDKYKFCPDGSRPWLKSQEP